MGRHRVGWRYGVQPAVPRVGQRREYRRLASNGLVSFFLSFFLSFIISPTHARTRELAELTTSRSSGYYQPEIYTDGTLEILKGSSANATHYKATLLAKGFSSWADFDGNVANLDGSAQIRFAYAYSTTPVDDPASVDSTFSIHNSVGRWVHDLGAARSESFADWVEANTVTAPPSNRTIGIDYRRGLGQRATPPAAAVNGTTAVIREERHPLVPQLRDSAKFIGNKREVNGQVNETAQA